MNETRVTPVTFVAHATIGWPTEQAARLAEMDEQTETAVSVHETADLDEDVHVASSAQVWHHAQLRRGVVVGEECVIGRGAYLGAGVELGAGSKVQNYALIYEPAVVEAGVFIGPAVVLTNDLRPRAVNPDLSVKSAEDWEPVGVTLRSGASIGARSVCVAPVEVGRWAMVGAGSVVVHDVPDHALVVGVPAHQIGWVGRTGHRLTAIGDGRWRCPETGEEYRESDGRLGPA